MAGTKETAEGLANLILGCCAAAWFNGGVGAVLTGTVGAVGLGALLFGKSREQDPESRTALARLRHQIIDGYMAEGETWTAHRHLAEADRALGRSLQECMLDRDSLAASARSGQRFPETATALVIARLAEKEPIFAELGAHPAANPQAREFAKAVLRAALTAALDSREWFERLEPRLMMEALQGIGEVSNKIDSRADRLEAQIAALTQKLESAGVVRQARDKGLTEAQVDAIMRAFAVQDFSPEDAEARLLTSAQELLALRDQLARLKNLDFEVTRLRNEAAAAIDDGELATARSKLAQARSRAADIAEGQMRTVAELDLEQGGLARAEGRLLEAANHFAAAAAYLAPIDVPAANQAWLHEYDLLFDHGENHPGLDSFRRAIDLAQNRVASATDPHQVAIWRIGLGDALQALGERADDDAGLLALHDAVATYRTVLQSYPREDSPIEWATIQGRLGNGLSAVGMRTGGEAGLSALNEAVAAYRAALEVQTPQTSPDKWAMNQNNLGRVLRVLCESAGGEAELAALTEAISAQREALKVFTRDSRPTDWASANLNLGALLHTLAEYSVDEAILRECLTCYRANLEVRTRDEMPLAWASGQNNLGNVLCTLGERTEGVAGLEALKESEAAYRAALEVRTREAMPVDWAMTMSNLGATLETAGVRARGEAGLSTLTDAVAAHRLSLGVFTRQEMPAYWAQSQHNLGSALQSLGELDETVTGLSVLNEAVVACRAALEVRGRKEMPLRWAMTQDILGKTLRTLGKRIGGAAGLALLNEAGTAHCAAMEVFTRQALPVLWADAARNECLLHEAKSEISRQPESVCSAVGLMDDVISVYTAMKAGYLLDRSCQDRQRMRDLCVALGGAC